MSFKVKKEIKRLMEKYKDRVNWADILREYLEEVVYSLEAEENMKIIMKKLESAKWRVPSGFSVRSVREDRDSR